MGGGGGGRSRATPLTPLYLQPYLGPCEVGLLVWGCYWGWGWSSVGSGGVEEAKVAYIDIRERKLYFP